MTAEEEFRQVKLDQIRKKRKGAARARRLAVAMWSDADRKNALSFAQELEAEALELALAVPPEPVPQIQVQVQQGPPIEDAKEGLTKSRNDGAARWVSS